MIDTAYPGKNALDPVPVVPFTEASSPAISEKNQVLLRRCVEEATGMLRVWRLPVWDERLAKKRPRTILIRARRYVPMPGSIIAGLDLKRRDKMLGWAEYDQGIFHEVVDVEGHHCSIFAQENIGGISEAVRLSLGKLERLGSLKAML
ncbi:hypothetical protein V501_09147 [Pseudogymnoascus sp. VKM F-4519 (FW-2642)]|nr:hypothetical protein V501_09147 [Pseudogymnoascus sp. VKM F-4519 (FW-2642)]